MADARRHSKPDMDHEVHGEATEKLDPSMATEELPEAPVRRESEDRVVVDLATCHESTKHQPAHPARVGSQKCRRNHALSPDVCRRVQSANTSI